MRPNGCGEEDLDLVRTPLGRSPSGLVTVVGAGAVAGSSAATDLMPDEHLVHEWRHTYQWAVGPGAFGIAWLADSAQTRIRHACSSDQDDYAERFMFLEWLAGYDDGYGG